MEYLTLKDLQDQLRRVGLVFSRPKLDLFYKKGLLKRPANTVHFRRSDASPIALAKMYIFTQEEILSSIEQVKHIVENKLA